MKRFLHILLLLPFLSFSQIGINTTTPNASSILDVTATNKGVLLPQINLQGLNDATTITNPATSLLVWNTGATWGKPSYYHNSGTPGAPVWSLGSSLNVTSETLTITSTGTSPTKATAKINDYISATDDDSGWVIIDFDYTHHAVAGAANGTGEYIFKLPTGYSFDTTIHPINTQATALSGNNELTKLIHLNGIIVSVASRSYRNYIIPYNATHFRIVTIDVNTFEFCRSGNFSFATFPLTYKGSFRFKKL
jgi:hypothetical protein